MSSTAFCEHGARCAGCAYLGTGYEAQLERKASLAQASLRRFPVLGSVPVMEPLAADPVVGYRTRVKWMVGAGGALGLYTRDGSHCVVDIPNCRVASPAIAEAGAALRALLSRGDLNGLERLRAVDLRELRDGAPRVWATLVFARGATPERAALERIATELRRRAPVVASVFLNEVEPDSVQVLGNKTVPIAGEEEGWDRVGGARLLVAPGSFVQAHAGQALAIASRLRARVRGLRESLGRPPRVLDLFAGSGTWGLAVAAEGADVLAIESYGPAAARIEAAARSAKLRVSARAEDAERATRELARSGERFDLVLVNPPRRGLAPTLRAAVAALAPNEVAYVSCDPATLARDLADFARLGLEPRSVTPIDMIPLTEHVEALALLAPGEPPTPVVLAATDTRLFVDKRPHEEAAELSKAFAGADGRRPQVLFAPPSDASGVAVLDLDGSRAAHSPPGAARAIVAVKGVVRKRGTLRDREGRTFRYVREVVASGHSLLRVDCALADVAHLVEPLAAIGHPPLGGPKVDPRTRRHFADRYRLDRSFLHVERVEIDASAVCAPLAPDLAVVAAALGFTSVDGADSTSVARSR